MGKLTSGLLKVKRKNIFKKTSLTSLFRNIHTLKKYKSNNRSEKFQVFALTISKNLLKRFKHWIPSKLRKNNRLDRKDSSIKILKILPIRFQELEITTLMTKFKKWNKTNLITSFGLENTKKWMRHSPKDS